MKLSVSDVSVMFLVIASTSGVPLAPVMVMVAVLAVVVVPSATS